MRYINASRYKRVGEGEGEELELVIENEDLI